MGNLVNLAIKLSWAKDPFDRFIVAHSKALEVDLITNDKIISANYYKAIW